jgi:Fic family protein
MLFKKREEIESLILKILDGKQEISLNDLAVATGLSKSNERERKTLSRAFKRLVEKGTLEAKGSARARVYVLKITPKSARDSFFKDIPLSTKSEALLNYMSTPLQARTPVGYKQEFLRDYDTNKTPYLNTSQRTELLAQGRSEQTVHPAGTYARNILNRLLIDLSWNSSRLEGNTYSLLETKRLIEFGEAAEGKDASEAQMILNHKGAIEYIIDCVDESQISSHQVYSIHAILSENLLGDSSASGRLRNISVGVTGTTYLPLENPHILKESFDIFIQQLNHIDDPFEQSLFALVHLSYLQAFEDVNKRTARLVANIPFIKKNLIPLSFTDIPKESYVTALLGVYEKTDLSLFRDLYMWAYKRSAQRYSAVQQSMGVPNLLKLKYRNEIQNIIRTLVIEKIARDQIVSKIKSLIKALDIPESESTQLFPIIETEVIGLHEGNFARFKIQAKEFEAWDKLQKN